LTRSCDLRADLEDEAIESVKAWIALTTRCSTVPPKLLKGYFKALYSFLARRWPDILAIIFRVCIPVLSRDCGLIDDRIGIVGPLERIGFPIHDLLPMGPPKAREQRHQS